MHATERKSAPHPARVHIDARATESARALRAEAYVEMCTDSEGSRCEEPVGTCVCVYAEGLAMDVSELRQAVSRLRQHADENEIADNPSPYIEVNGDLIDVGHLLVGVDAILHPGTEDAFRSYGLTRAPGLELASDA
jgi:hypothetical protein